MTTEMTTATTTAGTGDLGNEPADAQAAAGGNLARPAGLTGPASQVQARTKGAARVGLAGRVLIAAGNLQQHKYPALIQAEAASLGHTGLVISGNDWSTMMRRIRRACPDLFLVYDPVESGKLFASKDDPFPQAATADMDTEALFGLTLPTLEERIEHQINSGASVAMTPTGYIRAGDQLALRAVITGAEMLNRDDVVVLLPLDYKWLVGPALKTIVGVIKRSKHPVAITLGDSSSDPMSHAGVLAGARTLAALPGPPIFHKTDLAGFDLMAHGALAASVGVIASKRRAQIPDEKIYAPRTKKGATVLLLDLLRFRRTLDMTNRWYASRKSPDCTCRVCNGQPIDRFTSEDYDCIVAAQHNGVGILSLTSQAAAAGGYQRFWPDAVRDAVAAHQTLSQYVGTQIEPPRQLTAWNSGLPPGPSAP